MKSGQHYVLANDIAFSSPWSPLGNFSSNGTPTLDHIVLEGQGFTLRGMAVTGAYPSLLGVVSCALINHLNFEDVHLTCQSDGKFSQLAAGALAAGIALAVIEDVAVKSGAVTCTEAGSLTTGGVLGMVDASVLRHVRNGASVSGGETGGVVGRTISVGNADGPVVFDDVVNEGPVQYVGGFYDYVGGIIGRVTYLGRAVSMQNVQNFGSVTGPIVGGIIGAVQGTTVTSLTNSTNSGPIAQRHDSSGSFDGQATCGGIVGLSDSLYAGYSVNNVTSTGELSCSK